MSAVRMNADPRAAASATARFRHRLAFGAELEADGAHTRFRLWAPSAAQVRLELWRADAAGETGVPLVPPDEVLDMLPAEPGWVELRVACGAGTRYRYRVRALQSGEATGPGDEIAVPDPASRGQSGDVHDPSLVVDPTAYAWRHGAWQGRPWRETVLYEVHVGAWGGYAGVRQRLAGLAAIGVTAIELMPLADFPGPRNWGYDGVLSFAPDAAYGTPDQLKELIDEAHGLGLSVFLDVVYNHFGPDGNYLGLYAGSFFDATRHTLWGQAIDFARAEVSDFFVANALYWLMEYRFDGLRFDAVHAIEDDAWLASLAARVRAAVEPGRQVQLVLENDDNASHLLAGAFDAQWNDDGHHVLHVLLTGECQGYYRDYADAPATQLARVLSEGFVYQGQPSPHRGGAPRGEPSGGLPPTAFVLFLQNHDQIGNRAFGERLGTLADPDALRAATALLLLCPQIPLLFMGDEDGAREPFLYFTSHGDEALATAVREGRRREFEPFSNFEDPARRAAIPDPNALSSFEASVPRDATASAAQRAWVGELLALRHAQLVPRLDGARSLGAEPLGTHGVRARWQLGDASVWSLWANLGPEAAPVSAAQRDASIGAQCLLECKAAHAALRDAAALPGFGFALYRLPAAERPG